MSQVIIPTSLERGGISSQPLRDEQSCLDEARVKPEINRQSKGMQ